MRLPWRRRGRDRDLDDEVAAHLRMAAQDRIAQGESPEQASRNAAREFGNVALVKEVTRSMWAWAAVDQTARDVRYSLRALRRDPLFAMVAILCLGLGIGTTSAMFGIADALLLRPLPICNPSQVVAIGSTAPDRSAEALSYQDFVYLREHARSFEGIVGFHLAGLAVARDGSEVPRRKMGMYVAGEFFDVLGVVPVHGRGFLPEETNVIGRETVVVLSYAYWLSEFGGSPGVIGRSVRLKGIPHEIVGVAPEHFTVHPNLSPAFYVPVSAADRQSWVRTLNVRARLRQSVPLAEATAELESLSQGIERSRPATHAGHAFTVRTELGERIRQAPQLAVLSGVLLGLAFVVLVIACANVASLLLARSRSREREIAVRLSIGAGRLRLLRQFLTESLVLSTLACLA